MAHSVTGEKPTCHLILRDEQGVEIGLSFLNARGEPDATAVVETSVERSSLKTSSGNQDLSNLEPPYAAMEQKTWEGGRGARMFEDDVTRFSSSYRAETARAGKIILSGRETYATGARAANTSLPGSMTMIPLTSTRKWLAVRFAANANYTADKIWLWAACFGASDNDLTVRLRADGAGGVDPGAVLQTKVITGSSLYTYMLSELFPFDHTDQALVSGTYYWIEVYAETGDASDYWKIGMKTSAGTTKQSSDGADWDACAYDLYYRVTDNTPQMNGEFFDYKRMKYFVTRPTDGSASRVWMKGGRGVAKSNAGHMDQLLVNGASPGYPVNGHVGKVLLLIEGNGSEELIPWRVVTANAADSYDVDTPWLIEHDTTTVFVLLGDDTWTDITDAAKVTSTVTDVIAHSERYVFLAQGENDEIAQFKEDVAAGAWVRTWLQNTSKAVFLEEFNDGGTMKVVRSNGNTTVSQSSVPAWGGPLAWGAAQEVGDKWDRITGLKKYLDANESEAVWVHKESGPWIWDGSGLTVTARDEMKAIQSPYMGRASAKSDVYLFMSVMNTVWRFYSPTFDDVGPMLDEGLPANMQGTVSAIVAYPGRTLIAIDAGTTGYSSVLENNGGGAWHEKYRAPLGERIFDISFEVVPGTAIDRLWIRQGAGFLWIPYPSNAFDPTQDTNYQYTHEGSVELAPMYAGLIDAWKYWKSLKLQLEDLAAGETWVEADYRLDDGDWVTMPSAFTSMPLSEQNFSTTDSDGRSFGQSSKKFQLRVRLLSTNVLKSPILTAVLISLVTVIEPKFTYTFQTGIDNKDLNGNPDETLTPTQKMQQLRTWSGTAKSLWMTCVIPLYSGKGVFIAPMPGRPLTVLEHEGEYTYSTSITLQEA